MVGDQFWRRKIAIKFTQRVSRLPPTISIKKTSFKKSFELEIKARVKCSLNTPAGLLIPLQCTVHDGIKPNTCRMAFGVYSESHDGGCGSAIANSNCCVRASMAGSMNRKQQLLCASRYMADSDHLLLSPCVWGLSISLCVLPPIAIAVYRGSQSLMKLLLMVAERNPRASQMFVGRCPTLTAHCCSVSGGTSSHKSIVNSQELYRRAVSWLVEKPLKK